MRISVGCSGCGAKLTAADSAAGKKVRCPDCGATTAVPTSALNVRGRATAAEAEPRPKKRRMESQETDEPTPRKHRREADLEERPRRRRGDDDEVADAPSRKVKKTQTNWAVLGSVLALVVLVLGLSAWLVLRRRSPTAEPAPTPAPTLPREFTLVARVDGQDDFLFTAQDAKWEHRSGANADGVKLNGQTWSMHPVLPNAGQLLYLPKGVNFRSAQLTKKKGRGDASIVTRSDSNVVIRFDDTNGPGADAYEVGVTFGPAVALDDRGPDRWPG